MDIVNTGKSANKPQADQKTGTTFVSGLIGTVLAIILLCNLEEAISNLLGGITKGISLP